MTARTRTTPPRSRRRREPCRRPLRRAASGISVCCSTICVPTETNRVHDLRQRRHRPRGRVWLPPRRPRARPRSVGCSLKPLNAASMWYVPVAEVALDLPADGNECVVDARAPTARGSPRSAARITDELYAPRQAAVGGDDDVARSRRIIRPGREQGGCRSSAATGREVAHHLGDRLAVGLRGGDARPCALRDAAGGDALPPHTRDLLRRLDALDPSPEDHAPAHRPSLLALAPCEPGVPGSRPFARWRASLRSLALAPQHHVRRTAEHSTRSARSRHGAPDALHDDGHGSHYSVGAAAAAVASEAASAAEDSSAATKLSWNSPTATSSESSSGMRPLDSDEDYGVRR